MDFFSSFERVGWVVEEVWVKKIKGKYYNTRR